MQKRIAEKKTKRLVLTTALVVVFALVTSTGMAESPYPPSSVIKSITWHWDTHTTAAPGSDLWPVTWASDGNIYTAWGDGGGFGGTNSDGRVSMGFARIEGSPESYVGINVNGGKDSENPASFPKKGKSGGILSVRGTLYARLNLQDGEWPDVNFGLAWSEDLDATWTKASWVFPKGEGNFKPSRFLNFGKDYTGMPAHLAGFVYFYGFKQDTDSVSDKSTYMGRVPQSKIKDRFAYEFFKGLDVAGKPVWTSDIKKIQSVFTDPNGACLGAVVYNPGIKRYILTSFHTGPGQLGIFDAPEPWGSWTTMAYYDDWGNMGAAGFGLNCDFPQKWMSANGLTMWCVFSVYGDGAKKGINGHDKFNLVKAKLELRSNQNHAKTNRNNNGIQIYKENPRYWQYKGKPVLLLGGSDDDNLFQIPDMKEHLDLLASVGGNYIRNTMSARGDRGLEVQAFKRLPDGKYDLNHWNDEYWRRFESFLKLTNQRDIIVQIEVWAFHDFNKGHWEKNPWRPANNINFTLSNTTLRDSYGNIGRTVHDFFFTVPKLNDDRVVLHCQKKFVDKILSYSLQYGHVLYCMTNEIHPQYSPEWGWFWAGYIKDKAAAAGKRLETTEMFWEIDLKKKQQRASLDHAEIFSYFEASQNSAILGQKNWDNLQFVYHYLSEKQRPINHTKVYGADTCPWKGSTDRHATECFWRNIIGGSASSRFHRPPYGMGLGQKAQAHIKSMRLLTANLDFFNTVPDSRSRLLSNRSDNEAYLSYIPKKQYAVYFPNGGSVNLDLHEAAGQYVMKWIDIAQSRWAREETLEGGGTVTLSPPGTGHWAVWIGPVSTSQTARGLRYKENKANDQQ